MAISDEIAKACMTIEREVALQKELDGQRGMHSDIGGRLERELQIYKAGLQRVIPDEWAHILREHDPEYADYLRLKEKFEGEKQ